MIKEKLKALSIHLGLSLVFVSLILGLVIYFWYPLEYLGITNFKGLVLLILSIDLVLGPLLTFVVFNPNKKSLRFDLAAIAVIQVAALSYGVHALYQTHPLYITYNHGSFNLISANEVTPSDAKHDKFKISKLSAPILAYAKMPEDPEKIMSIMVGVDLKGEADIDKRTEFYESHIDHIDTILADSLKVESIFKKDNLNKETKSFLDQYQSIEKFAFLPIQGTNGDAIIVLDRKSAKHVTTINTNPWKHVKADINK